MSFAIKPLGDPILRKISRAVADPGHKEVIAACEAMAVALSGAKAQNGLGRGIAAPQVGYSMRLIRVELQGNFLVMVNPEVVDKQLGKISLWDDCLSFPEILVRLERSPHIAVEYWDLKGQRHLRSDFTVAEAELIQHEIDHLNGILSIDRSLCRNSLITRKAYQENPDYFNQMVDLAPGRPEWKRPA